MPLRFVVLAGMISKGLSVVGGTPLPNFQPGGRLPTGKLGSEADTSLLWRGGLELSTPLEPGRRRLERRVRRDARAC